MHFPRVVVWESGKDLTNRLTPLCIREGWSLRQVRDLEQVLETVPDHSPAAVVLEVIQSDGRELLWLESIRERRPAADVIAVVHDGEWAGACWDLGVACVIRAERACEEIGPVLEGLMKQRWTKGEGGVPGIPGPACR